MPISPTISLNHPIDNDGKMLTSLAVRPMTVGDLCAADLVEGQTKKNAALIASMSGVPLPIILKLHVSDFARAMEALDGLGESESQDGSTP